MNELETLAQEVGAALKNRAWMLATAESCTGGWVAQAVTAIAGSSAWLDRGFVTYSNQAKQDMLGVQTDTLAANGAVSQAVVKEMAAGALRNSQAQISVAISGIAGPDGGTPDKPVGTVWFGWAWPNGEKQQCCCFEGEREQVRRQAVVTALREILILAQNPPHLERG